jgi:LPS-assembly protein
LAVAAFPERVLSNDSCWQNFFAMTHRTRFLITALLLCHQLPAAAVVTRRLLAENPDRSGVSQQTSAKKREDSLPKSRCAAEAEAAQAGEATICAIQQEKIGPVYKLHGDVEIYYLNYVLRADDATYNSDTGEAMASGHFRLDGGANDDHIRASHGTYNLTTETGSFYDVTGTTGFRFEGNRAVLTSTAPFSFNGKRVEKTSPDRYLVYDGSITTCELPHPKWKFNARKVIVDVGGNASIYHSTFLLTRVPIFYFPYATHPVNREARQTGFLVPSGGRSSSNGTEFGDAFYWDINRSLDATIGGEYFSKRGWLQRGDFRARPSDTSYVELSYFGVIDRGIEVGTPTGPQLLREGGEEVRLLGQGNFDGIRAVSNVDYLSAFIFRLAFNDSFSQAINSEVKSQMFLEKDLDGLAFGGMVERYQNYFQLAQAGTLTNPPRFKDVEIWHTPSIDASGIDRRLPHTPFAWDFSSSFAGLSRSDPNFNSNNVLRLDFDPEISLPLLFHGWSLRPAVAAHETYYTQRIVSGNSVGEAITRQAVDASVEVRPPPLEKVFDKDFLGRKWKHVIEPEVTYRYVTGINNFGQILKFDEHDILSDTNEVEYGFTTRLYAKRKPSSVSGCESPMTALAVGGAAPPQSVPWQRITNAEKKSCLEAPAVKEMITWSVFQKYFVDPTFGGALVPGQRNVFTSTEELTGIAFLTQARHLSPAVSRLRVATSSRIDTEWDLDYDFRPGRINSSTLLVNYNLGPFTLGGGDSFLQIPQTKNTTNIPSEGACSSNNTAAQPTCKFQQFRVGLGYGNLTRRGFSGAANFGLDAEINQLQFASLQSTYNWDCCGLTLEYRRYAIGNVRNENLFRFNFTLANIGSFGNLRPQERLY